MSITRKGRLSRAASQRAASVLPIPAGPTNRMGDHVTAIAHRMQGEVVVQLPANSAKLGKSRWFFDQFVQSSGSSPQLAAFVASGPMRSRRCTGPAWPSRRAWRGGARQSCILRRPETRFGVLPRCLRGGLIQRRCRWLHVGSDCTSAVRHRRWTDRKRLATHRLLSLVAAGSNSPAYRQFVIGA